MLQIRYTAEMDFACLYAFRNPALARICADEAHRTALRMGRPDLAYDAAELLACLW